MKKWRTVQLIAFSVLALLAAVGFAIIWPSLGIGPAAHGPKIVLPETSFDFGEVFEDKELSHTFVIRNAGDAPLEISEIDPDCHCTAAKYDRVIPPGREGSVTLTLKPYSVMRQFKKAAKIRTNDPKSPLQVVSLAGVSRAIIEAQPSQIIRLRGSMKEKIRSEVRFTSNQAEPWQITGFRTNIPDKIDITLKTVEPGKVYVLEVTNKAKAPGPYVGIVELTTTSNRRPRMAVRVFADIYSPDSGRP